MNGSAVVLMSFEGVSYLIKYSDWLQYLKWLKAADNTITNTIEK